MSDVELVTSVDDDIVTLASRAIEGLATTRGGAALRRDLEAVCGADSPTGIIESLSQTRSLLCARQDGCVIGLLAVTHVAPCTIIGVYVDESDRRRGVGGALVRAARTEFGAHDGWASPGDRATKSLYESAGWKARLLTMSDEEA